MRRSKSDLFPRLLVAALPFLALVAILALLAPHALAQSLPAARLYSVFPPGAKQGSTVDVSIGGEDLENASQLQFSVAGITAVQKTQPPALGQEGPQPVPNQFTVTVTPDAPAGICEVRVVGKYGVSNPRSFVVGTRDELVETEPNNSIQQATEVPLGATVNGVANGGTDQDYYKFTAKAGQRVIVDCWAYRIDSRMDPSLVLYDANGKELDRSRDTNRRDPMLDFTVPSDGDYFVEIHDFLYAGNGEYYYRLNMGVDAHLDFVFPPAGLPGSTETYTLYGRNLPGGQASELVSGDGKPLESLAVQITLPADPQAQARDFQGVVEPDESAIDAFAYQLNTPAGLTNSVLIGYASAPVVAEQEPNNEASEAQAVAPPCEYVGRFGPESDRDWITFEAKKGQTLWMEVFSQRLGLPTDPFLLIQQVTKNDKGEEQVKELAAVDDYLDNPQGQVRRGMAIYDMRTADPAHRFVAPEDGTYRVLVRNMASYTHYDPRLLYRLTIRPEQPDFRLIAKPRLLPFSNDPNQNPPTVWSPLLRKGGTEMIDVVVFRREGFNGPVEVSIAGLPPGVTSAPITLAPGQEVGELVVSAAEDAPESVSVVNVVGKATLGGQPVERPARYATMVWGGQNNVITPRSRLARTLAISVSGGETAPFYVAATGPLETCKAGKVELPVKLVRRGDFAGAVTLTPFPVPPNVKPPTLTLDDKTQEGKLEIALAPNTPSGSYSFTLVATSAVNYARNPEAVAEATARKAAVDKIAAELAADAKAKADAKAAADKQAADMTAAMEKAKAEAEAAAKELAAAQAKAQAASQAMASAEAQLKAAAEAKAAAEKAAAEADAQAKQAAEVQKAVDKQVADTTAAAKPKAINVAAASPTVTLKVAEAPITLELTAPVAAQPGATIEVPIKLSRLYGFADAIALAAKPSGDAKSVTVADLSLPADQTEGKLAVTIGTDTPPGTYNFNVQATAKFNGQDLSVTQPVAVVVEAPAAK